MTDGYIEDGYTRDFFIKGIPGLYPDAKGTFRPLLGWEIAAMWRKQNKCRDDDDEGREFVLGKTITAQISAWDIAHEGSALPVNADSFKRLVPALRQAVANIVMGNEPPTPTKPAEQPQEEWERERDAYLAGKPVDDAGN